MKIQPIIAALALCVLSIGCAHHAALVGPPDASRMEASHAALTAGVTRAKADAGQIATLIGKASNSHAIEVAQLSETDPKTQALLRQAPPDLRPMVESLAGDLNTLKGDQEAHEEDLRAVETAQDAHTSQLDELATKADDAAKDRADYEADANKLADRVNAAENGWAADSKALAWYRLHWWGAWLMLGAGLAVSALIAFLKFTGRLAISIPKL